MNFSNDYRLLNRTVTSVNIYSKWFLSIPAHHDSFKTSFCFCFVLLLCFVFFNRRASVTPSRLEWYTLHLRLPHVSSHFGSSTLLGWNLCRGLPFIFLKICKLLHSILVAKVKVQETSKFSCIVFDSNGFWLLWIASSQNGAHNLHPHTNSWYFLKI